MTSLAHHWEQQGVEKGIQIGEAKGLQIGRNEGVQIGRNEGKHERTIEVAKNMLDNNYSIPEVSRITGLSISELNKLFSPNH